MIVDSGKNDISVQYIKANYQKIKVGVGSDDTTAGAVDLDSPIVQSNGTVLVKTSQVPEPDGSRLKWSVSFTGAELGTQGVSEIGIFKNTGDVMLCRATFKNTGIVSSTDVVTFYISLEVN